MREIPKLMDEQEFRKELGRVKGRLETISQDNNIPATRRSYLIGWICSPSAPIYTPDQLRQIFELVWK